MQHPHRPTYPPIHRPRLHRVSQQQAPACASWGTPGPGPSGALEGHRTASTLPPRAWPTLPLPSSPVPGEAGQGHSLILPGVAVVAPGRAAPASQGSGVLRLAPSVQTSAQGTQGGGSTEPQGQPAPLTSPAHFPSVLPFAGQQDDKCWDCGSRWSRQPEGTKRAPSPQQGPCPTRRSPPHPPPQARAAHE